MVSCKELETVLDTVGGSGELTTTEIVSGLKSALEVGTKSSVDILSKPGGFLNDASVMIPFPDEAQRASDKLRQIGAGNLVDKFVNTMNEGAEKAVVKAVPIFVNAIKSMSIADAKGILFSDNKRAATDYFKSKTSSSLTTAFRPDIDQSLEQVNATKYWTDVTGTYNKIPFVKPVNTDLTGYVTDKALEGLFKKVALEEAAIRENPAKRVTEILKKVFAKQDS